MESTQVSQRSR